MGGAQSRHAPAHWLKMVAHRLWVCTTPPMFSKLRYSSQWVSVSEEGFHLPSTFLPVRMSTSTMSSGESWSYSTPLGLMAHNAALPVDAADVAPGEGHQMVAGSSMLA